MRVAGRALCGTLTRCSQRGGINNIIMHGAGGARFPQLIRVPCFGRRCTGAGASFPRWNAPPGGIAGAHRRRGANGRGAGGQSAAGSRFAGPYFGHPSCTGGGGKIQKLAITSSFQKASHGAVGGWAAASPAIAIQSGVCSSSRGHTAKLTVNLIMNGARHFKISITFQRYGTNLKRYGQTSTIIL